MPGQKRGDDRRREDRVGEAALRRDDGDRARQAAVLRDLSIDDAVEQDRTERQPDRAIDRAFEGHIDRTVGDLRRGAGEIDRHLIAFDDDGGGDLEILARRIGVVQITIDEGLGGIGTIGNFADGIAHQTLGIIHQVFIGAVDRFGAIALHQIEEALRADLGRGNLRIHIADDQIGDADIIAHHVPHGVVAHAAIDDLDRLELQALGIAIDRVDHAAATRGVRANIEMVGRGDRKADQRIVVENRHAERDIGPMRGAAIGIVVHDHVARAHGIAADLQPFENAADVAGDRPRLQRRAHLAFAELAALGIG